MDYASLCADATPDRLGFRCVGRSATGGRAIGGQQEKLPRPPAQLDRNCRLHVFASMLHGRTAVLISPL